MGMAIPDDLLGDEHVREEFGVNQQRSIWKFAGILFILMIVFYIVLIVGVAISAGAAAANGLTVPVDGAANP